MLAVTWAVTEKFKDYLLGSKYAIITDNNPLSYLQTSAKLGAVEQRWQAQLAQYNFTITYRSGKLNRAADALSRMPSIQDLKLDTTDLPTDLQVEALQMAIEIIEQEVCNSDEVLDSEVLFCDSVFALPKFDRNDLQQMQQNDATVGEIWKYVQKRQKPSRQERAQLSHKAIVMLRQ